MRAPIRSTHSVCTSCLLREGRRRVFSTARLRALGLSQISPSASPAPFDKTSATKQQKRTKNRLVRKCLSAESEQPRTDSPSRPVTSSRSFPASDTTPKRAFSSINTDEIKLSPEQLNEVQIIYRLRNRLQSGVDLRKSDVEQLTKGLPLAEVLKPFEASKESEKEARIIQKLEGIYPGRDVSEVINDLDLLTKHRSPSNRIVREEQVKKLLDSFGVLAVDQDATAKEDAVTSDVRHAQEGSVQKTTEHPVADGATPPRPSSPQEEILAPLVKESSTLESDRSIAQLDKSRLRSLDSRTLAVRAMSVPRNPVATLSYGLRRVLFNQGVHQLQDQRTGVYNFDPYLQRIMPVSEFNFDALGEYVTSSEDTYLRNLARKHKKRYIGSSSSMSGALTHFHHLLSQFREISFQTLSQTFTETAKTLTLIQKAPSAVFLRYKDGVYGIDADKEFDSANILMSLGRSLEKLLTVPKEVFEQYRKTESNQDRANLSAPDPEAYHYCEQGDFLLRSQLDAYDPALPGTGMFDLKTRAVVSIRMNVSNHEEGVGYQIKSRFGNYESYEREYYDMIRSAFLKYTLQVRMGRMDGIFVAYHNIERIFGFQYLPLTEMDLHLHGQKDRHLGDVEFKLSIAFLNEIFDLAAAKFPQKSLRFHFEARPGTSTKPAPYMYIFAEPFEDHQIQAIQDSQKEKIAEAQRRLLNQAAADALTGSKSSTEATPPKTNSDADVDFLNALQKEPTLPEQPAALEADAGRVDGNSPILGLKLTIRNRQNGVEVPRPQNLERTDSWTVDYNIEEMGAEMAGRLYRACQARRKVALAQDSSENASFNFYMRRLRELSSKGAEWRKEQDALDAKRGVVVL